MKRKLNNLIIKQDNGREMGKKKSSWRGVKEEIVFGERVDERY